MNYQRLDEMLTGRCKQSRKLANNTYAQRRSDGVIAIRLHDTDVLTFGKDGTVVYNTGGWKTLTTKDRFNSFGPSGVTVFSDKGIWYISNRYGKEVFRDLCGANKDTTLFGYSGNADDENAKRKQVREYAKSFVASLFEGKIGPPDAGDCFFCQGIVKTLHNDGGSVRDTHHLWSHIEESYFVPTLLLKALHESGSPFEIKLTRTLMRQQADQLGSDPDSNKSIVRRFTKYLNRQLGLAA